MSETTHQPTGEEQPPGRPQPKMVVTRYPTAPEVLVLTAPNNIPMSFAQLLAMAGVGSADIQQLTQQLSDLTARVAALESAA